MTISDLKPNLFTQIYNILFSIILDIFVIYMFIIIIFPKVSEN